jgi:hypothetical protein
MKIISQLVLDDNNIAFHPAMGNSYQLNDTGALVVNLLKQHKTNDEIIEELSNTFGISKKELFVDMSDFITKLRIYGLE